ncbi:MAG: phosphoglucomutase [Desulfobulbaceae bacterium]|nr:phosphoglucomutase [Desulfobulbaceae bacterium]
MTDFDSLKKLHDQHLKPGDHSASDYFAILRQLVAKRQQETPASPSYNFWQGEIERVYRLLEEEIRNNHNKPLKPVKFGTSGWRGVLGKELFATSVAQVALAIAEIYEGMGNDLELQEALGVSSPHEARRRGCLLGYDNRFGGEILAAAVADVLTGLGFTVHYAGESTTGVLSAALLELKAAFSINLTPSHNPLEYGGFKFNAADGGPASPVITDQITSRANEIINTGRRPSNPPQADLRRPCDALGLWLDFVAHGSKRHGLNQQEIIAHFFADPRLVLAIDAVHGASRVHLRRLFGDQVNDRLIFLRDTSDPTFGGIAPEPSAANLAPVRKALNSRPEPLKLGMIIDPDADRIRFTDGVNDIDMNRFGVAAYHYLHEGKGRRGLVAKSVATSNFANAVAKGLCEEVFESKVGFKEFKPVIGRALVMFEESDGISLLGHTPEKDAYIGLFLALDLVLNTGKNLGEYIAGIEEQFGAYFPGRSSITVSLQGEALSTTLEKLARYRVGSSLTVGGLEKKIVEILAIDGRKLILDDGSWLLIRPSGTEPKVRFYVEARSADGCQALIDTAQRLLTEVGLFD